MPTLLNDTLTRQELRAIPNYLDDFDVDTLHELVGHIKIHRAHAARSPHKRQKMIQRCLETEDCALLCRRIFTLLHLTYIPGKRISAVQNGNRIGIDEDVFNGEEISQGSPVVTYSREIRNEAEHALRTCEVLLANLGADDTGHDTFAVENI